MRLEATRSSSGTLWSDMMWAAKVFIAGALAGAAATIRYGETAGSTSPRRRVLHTELLELLELESRALLESASLEMLLSVMQCCQDLLPLCRSVGVDVGTMQQAEGSAGACPLLRHNTSRPEDWDLHTPRGYPTSAHELSRASQLLDVSDAAATIVFSRMQHSGEANDISLGSEIRVDDIGAGEALPIVLRSGFTTWTGDACSTLSSLADISNIPAGPQLHSCSDARCKCGSQLKSIAASAQHWWHRWREELEMHWFARAEASYAAFRSKVREEREAARARAAMLAATERFSADMESRDAQHKKALRDLAQAQNERECELLNQREAYAQHLRDQLAAWERRCCDADVQRSEATLRLLETERSQKEAEKRIGELERERCQFASCVEELQQHITVLQERPVQCVRSTQVSPIASTSRGTETDVAAEPPDDRRLQLTPSLETAVDETRARLQQALLRENKQKHLAQLEVRLLELETRHRYGAELTDCPVPIVEADWRQLHWDQSSARGSVRATPTPSVPSPTDLSERDAPPRGRTGRPLLPSTLSPVDALLRETLPMVYSGASTRVATDVLQTRHHPYVLPTQLPAAHVTPRNRRLQQNTSESDSSSAVERAPSLPSTHPFAPEPSSAKRGAASTAS